MTGYDPDAPVRCEVCKRYPGRQKVNGAIVVIYQMPTPRIRWRCTDCGGGPRFIDAPRNQPDVTRYADHTKQGAGWTKPYRPDER